MSAFPFKWSKIQSASDMDVGRYFEYDSDAMEMFRRWLPLVDKKVKILEVGSGSGFFTEKLHQLYPKGRITCLEPDVRLREALSIRFPSAEIIDTPLEELDGEEESFDIVLSHIVIHNLPNPIRAIERMVRSVRTKGYVVCIEPVLGSRQYFPNNEVGAAIDTLWQYNIIMCKRRDDAFGNPQRENPYRFSYPEFFEELGLENIRCHGWCSVFTLSDTRFDFESRKEWIKRRRDLFESERKTKTETLLAEGMDASKIDAAYQTLFGYFDLLEKADEQQLAHIHEQEITSRVIVIGQKP